MRMMYVDSGSHFNAASLASCSLNSGVILICKYALFFNYDLSFASLPANTTLTYIMTMCNTLASEHLECYA